MAQMVGKTGLVVGIDRIQGLVDLSKNNILKQDKYLLDEGRVKLYFGDGWDGCKDGKVLLIIYQQLGTSNMNTSCYY